MKKHILVQWASLLFQPFHQGTVIKITLHDLGDGNGSITPTKLYMKQNINFLSVGGNILRAQNLFKFYNFLILKG